MPRGSEGLANNLPSPVGHVDSRSTTGPVFRSDQGETDPATVKAGGVEEWRKGGKTEEKGMVQHKTLSFYLFLSLSHSLPGNAHSLKCILYCKAHVLC